MRYTASDRLPLIIGVTGHRDLIDSELPLIRRRVAAWLAKLRADYPDLPLLILTGLAEGADSLVANIAHEQNVEVINVLPMPISEYRRDFNKDALQDFERLAALGETIELAVLPSSLDASLPSSQDGEATGDERVDRSRQYEQLGVFLAAHCHILLALWDGKTTTGLGGTSQVIDFHRRDASALNSSEQLRSELDSGDDESDLIFHVHCGRQSSGPASGGEAGAGHWFTRSDIEPRTDEMPSRYDSVFEHMTQFNIDAALVAEKSDTGALMPEPGDPTRDEICAPIAKLFATADALALRYQHRVHWALRTTIIAVLIAGLAFIIYADFDNQQNMIWVYFLFMGLAISSYYLARWRDWQRRYLDYRVLAEALRVQYFWALAGVTNNRPARFSHDSLFRGRDLELGWIRNAMRAAGLRADGHPIAGNNGLTQAVRYWVGNERDGQHAYYARRAGTKLAKHRNTGRLTLACFVAGLLAAIVLAFAADRLGGMANNLLVALMGLLPIVAAARHNYAHRMAERELVAQYDHMLNVFARAERMIDRAGDDSSAVRQILQELGDTALEENAQWVLRQRERPLPGSDAMA
ncbi:MAG: hypothetical protein NXH85_16350 [Pseudomonadaceae bacterium]|nr:hypothetical protein [Pseudomonadaceae bacterium]